jgi:hypothetical protein
MKTINKILIMVTGICLTVLLSTGCSPYTAAVGVAARVNPDGVAASVVTPVKKAAVGGVKAAGKGVADTTKAVVQPLK